VPPGVSAPGPAAEGDAAAGERGVFGVEVHCFEVVHTRLPDPGDPRDLREVRHLSVSADVVLFFDLNFLGSHDQPSFHLHPGPNGLLARVYAREVNPERFDTETETSNV
jgi:hypothetical protein